MPSRWSELVGSIFRVGWPRDERQALKAMRSSLLLHLHAPRVRPASRRFAVTWGLGVLSVLTAVLLTLTGVYLMVYYIPHPDAAYRSMKDLEFVVPFGRLMRNLHRWSAHAMVVVVTLHLVRVFLAGGYKAPRQFNWVAGVALWVLTLALSFTGYLLPWDQLAFWAVTVGSYMVAAIPLAGDALRELLLGDRTVGEAALLRFNTLHCIALPLAMGGLMAFHLFRVRKDGGLVVAERLQADAEAGAQGPESAAEARLEPAWPGLLYREVVLVLVATAALLALSLWANAPLEVEADPARTPNPAKAPWYFLGVQELAHFSAFWGGVFVPAMLVAVLLALPYVDRSSRGVGVYLARERRVATALFLAVAAFLAVVTVVRTLFRGPAWALMWWPEGPAPRRRGRRGCTSRSACRR